MIIRYLTLVQYYSFVKVSNGRNLWHGWFKVGFRKLYIFLGGSRHWVCILPLVQTIILVPNCGEFSRWTTWPLEKVKVALSTKIHVRLHNSQNPFPSENSGKGKYTRPHEEDRQSSNRKNTVKTGSGRDSHRERLKDAHREQRHSLRIRFI